MHRSWHLLAALSFVIVVGAVVIVVKHDSLAWYAWQRLHAPQVAVLLAPGDAPLALALGEYYFNGGAYNLPAAQYYLRRAVAADPGIMWGHYELGRILFVENDLPGALAELDLELKYNPENLRVLYMRGLVYGYQSDYPDAEADFTRFIAWVPTEWAGYNDDAWVLAEDKKYSEAKTVLGQAFVTAFEASTNPWLWNSLGVQDLNLKDYAGAVAAFTKAKSLAAALSESQWARAYPGDAPGSTAGGLDAFRSAIAANLTSALADSVDK